MVRSIIPVQLCTKQHLRLVKYVESIGRAPIACIRKIVCTRNSVTCLTVFLVSTAHDRFRRFQHSVSECFLILIFLCSFRLACFVLWIVSYKNLLEIHLDSHLAAFYYPKIYTKTFLSIGVILDCITFAKLCSIYHLQLEGNVFVAIY